MGRRDAGKKICFIFPGLSVHKGWGRVKRCKNLYVLKNKYCFSLPPYFCQVVREWKLSAAPSPSFSDALGGRIQCGVDISMQRGFE
jgi:hypothetical protein